MSTVNGWRWLESPRDDFVYANESKLTDAIALWMTGKPGFIRSEGVRVCDSSPSRFQCGGIPDLMFQSLESGAFIVCEVKLRRQLRRAVDVAGALGQLALYASGVRLILDSCGWTDLPVDARLYVDNDVGLVGYSDRAGGIALARVAALLGVSVWWVDSVTDGDGTDVWPDDVDCVFYPHMWNAVRHEALTGEWIEESL